MNNPTAGVPHSTTLDSVSYLLGGEIGIAMIGIYYANGDSSTYEGIVSLKI